MPKEDIEEVALDEKAVEAIANQVVKGMDIDGKIKEALGESVEKAIDNKIAAIEEITKKNVKEPDIKGKDAMENLSKEMVLANATKAFLSGDQKTLKEYNALALEARAKAGYANSTVSADGGYLVMMPEFEAEVDKLVNDYGVAFREATVVPVESPTIWTNKRGSNVSMFEVGSEGGQKSGTKLTISQQQVTLREFAAIAVVTNRLSDDAAIDFWAELTAGFAEARAQIADRIVFTDTQLAYPGILHLPGTIIEGVGAAITSITWDDLLNVEGKLPTAVQAGIKFYMHRTIWNQLLQVKDSNGRYQLPPYAGFKTPWGREVVLVDQMPAITSYGDANEGYVIAADLKRTKLYVKRGLELTISEHATVHDSDGNSVNLFEKNMKALRAETRMIHLTKFPEAVGVIGTGTVS